MSGFEQTTGNGLLCAALFGFLICCAIASEAVFGKHQSLLNQSLDLAERESCKHRWNDIDEPAAAVQQDSSSAYVTDVTHNLSNLGVKHLAQYLIASLDLILEKLGGFNLLLDPEKHNQVSAMEHPQAGVDRILKETERLIRAAVTLSMLKVTQSVANLKESESHTKPPRRQNNPLVDEVIQPNQ